MLTVFLEGLWTEYVRNAMNKWQEETVMAVVMEGLGSLWMHEVFVGLPL